MHCRLSQISSLLLLLLFAVMTLSAQTITANISGTVTDPSGAVISGATITAKNVETNVETSAHTNAQGIYSIRFLQVGKYTVTISSTGFADQISPVITLEAAQDAKIDGKLGVAGEQQKMDINADLVPLLNTENAQLATTLDRAAIESVPMIGRNFVELTLFLPGAVSTTPAGFAGNAAIGVGGQQVSVNGNREQSNNYLLDGIEINETLNNGVGYNPSPDALSQLQVVSANAQAEYGNVNGGDVIAITKSGTNQWHGSAYYYLSNYLLDANTWGNKHGGTIIQRGSYTQPIFGGTFGGPIIKDKLFFFVDYTGGRYHFGGQAANSVATAKMRQGDFSELLNPANMCANPSDPKTCTAKSLIQLYDSSTLAFTPYAGNVNVPIVNPIARYLYAHPEFYPLPNALPIAGTPAQNNYIGASKTRRYNNQEDVKIDWKASGRDNLSVRYSQSDNGQTSTNPLAITFPVAPQTPVKGVAINEVHTFSSSIVNELRIGFTRVHPLGGTPSDTTGAFGLNGNKLLGINNTVQPYPGFIGQFFSPPSTTGVTTPNGSYFTTLGNADTATNYADNSFTYGDNLTYLHGRHTFKFGVQFIRYQQNSFYPGNDGSIGTVVYNGNFSSNPNGGTNNTNGFSIADFNLDRLIYVGTGSATGAVGPTGQRQWRDAYFAQDDWRITDKLVLNLGIRYEYDQPMYEVNNKQTSVDFVTKQLITAGKNGYSRALVNPYYGGVMPRFGFSYQATQRMVVRGGYGIQNYMEGTGANRRMTVNPPFQSPYFAQGSAPSATSTGQFFRAENGFSNPASSTPTLSINAWDPNIRPAFIGEYSLTTEYQISNTASLQVGYVGESGQHLVNHGAANQLTAPCVVGGVVSATPNSAACAAAQPAPFRDLVGQAGSIVETTSNAMMNYNALQATLRQRTWHGLNYTLNYAYGRSMTNAVGFYGSTGIANANNYNENNYNNHIEYGPASQDVRHNINGVVGYQLPFGRGRAFGGNMNRALDEVIGGWKVAMTAVAYTGFPLTINNSTNNAYTNNKVQRANHLRPLIIKGRSLNNWFGTDPSVASCGLVDNGTCAYGSPANGTYGTAVVGSERAPGYQQYDASASKDFSIFHDHKVGFKVDASNVLNLTSLGNPNNTAQSTTFGQITTVRSGPRRLQLSAKYEF